MSSSIPPKILKENNNVCCGPLMVIFNNSVSNSCFDSGLKCADVTPVHKAEETTDKNVSLLPVVSKIFERIMERQIFDYLETFLSPSLCGYRKGYSAQQALLSMLEKWLLTP